jgi:hypothetical protein
MWTEKSSAASKKCTENARFNGDELVIGGGWLHDGWKTKDHATHGFNVSQLVPPASIGRTNQYK